MVLLTPAAEAAGAREANELIFSDGFESGDVWSWSVVFPPDPTEPAEGLFFVPTVLELGELGQQGEVTLTLRDFPHSVWGAELYLLFDPTVVHVTRVDVGQCPPPELVVLNEVDNGVGELRYAAVPLELGPCAVSSGDLDILTVQLQRAGVGVARIAVDATRSVLSDGEVAVEVSTRDGWIVP